METLFRWSKFVDEDRLDEWEIRLIAAEVAFTADKPVNRKRWQLSSYVLTRGEADLLRARYGGGVNEVYPHDWQPSAEEGIPFILKVRDRLVITEAANGPVLDALVEQFRDRIVLSFPPQLAFGTGGHPTTAGCLRFLSDIAKERAGRDWSLIDLGCGSGILAIAAAKLGASRIVAVEIDDVALKFAIQNAERHGVADRIEFVEGDAIPLLRGEGSASFDVIAANLFSTLLVELLPNFPEGLNQNGDFVISGFLTSQTREILEAAQKSGLQLDDYLRRGKWVAARGRRKNGPQDGENS
ncbi:MAG: 50S ribosomal protein L11 methyltransferase [Verrucomicrobiales bacterium]|nr:50S ribosomal protein L11 methyltransferase [Verrucomicrobiales bacterium]